MQQEKIVGIAVRLFAIFLVLYTLRQVSGLLPLAALPPPNNVSLLFILVMAMFPLIAAGLLWLFPLTVASKIVPATKNRDKTPPLKIAEIEVVAFAVMGLWVLATAIPDTFYWATFALRLKYFAPGEVQLEPEQIGNVVATVVEITIGLWLLFGSRGILQIIRTFRQT